MIPTFSSYNASFVYRLYISKQYGSAQKTVTRSVTWPGFHGVLPMLIYVNEGLMKVTSIIQAPRAWRPGGGCVHYSRQRKTFCDHPFADGLPGTFREILKFESCWISCTNTLAAWKRLVDAWVQFIYIIFGSRSDRFWDPGPCTATTLNVSNCIPLTNVISETVKNVMGCRPAAR